MMMITYKWQGFLFTYNENFCYQKIKPNGIIIKSVSKLMMMVTQSYVHVVCACARARAQERGNERGHLKR